MCFNTHKITDVGHKVQLMNKKLDKIFAKFGLEIFYEDGQITMKPMGKASKQLGTN
jgi:hypothetical protein